MALAGFFLFFDALANFKKLTDSVNIKILYLAFRFGQFFLLLCPLALVFASISTKISLIYSNYLVALYAIAYSKKQLLAPMLAISVFFSMLLVGLSFTPFAYFKSQADALISKEIKNTNHLFFKYKDHYIYFEKLFVLQKRVLGVRVFKVNNLQLEEVLYAKSAIFKDNFWIIKGIIGNRKIQDANGSWQLRRIKSDAMKSLEGFKPQLLEKVYEQDIQQSSSDILEAIYTFSNEDVDINNFYSALYTLVIYPFFAPALIVIIFIIFPISTRLATLSQALFYSIFFALVVWGGLYSVAQLAVVQNLNAQYAVLLPLCILFLGSFWTYLKKY